MDLIDKLTELAARIQRQKDSVTTEEATKTAFVLPFLHALGYDVFNPAEVVPELTADHGVKKGEKVDYAIKRDSSVVILIECKMVGADLEAKYAGQLFRYFSVTEARFGVLTDGVRYLFFSDLEQPNRLDDRPFFEFNLLQFNEAHVEELKKFSRSSFNIDTIIGTASKLKYHRALMAELRNEFENPGEELVRLLTARVHSGRFTQQVRAQFTDLVQRALRDFIREQVNERLKSALETSESQVAVAVEPSADPAKVIDEVTEIETTEDEIAGYRMVQAIGAEITDPDRIAIRDAKSYCAILWNDNNRRPICRFHFKNNKKTLIVFAPSGEARFELEKLTDLYKHKAWILEAIGQYQKGS